MATRRVKKDQRVYGSLYMFGKNGEPCPPCPPSNGRNGRNGKNGKAAQTSEAVALAKIDRKLADVVQLERKEVALLEGASGDARVKKERKTRSDAGVARGARVKKERKTRSDAGVARGSRKKASTAMVLRGGDDFENLPRVSARIVGYNQEERQLAVAGLLPPGYKPQNGGNGKIAGLLPAHVGGNGNGLGTVRMNGSNGNSNGNGNGGKKNGKRTLVLAALGIALAAALL